MTIRELKELLENHDEDTKIVVSGYESGFNEALRVRLINVVMTDKELDETWEGDYELAYEGTILGRPVLHIKGR